MDPKGRSMIDPRTRPATFCWPTTRSTWTFWRSWPPPLIMFPIKVSNWYATSVGILTQPGVCEKRPPPLPRSALRSRQQNASPPSSPKDRSLPSAGIDGGASLDLDRRSDLFLRRPGPGLSGLSPFLPLFFQGGRCSKANSSIPLLNTSSHGNGCRELRDIPVGRIKKALSFCNQLVIHVCGEFVLVSSLLFKLFTPWHTACIEYTVMLGGLAFPLPFQLGILEDTTKERIVRANFCG
jgi:hypothetical protein